MTDAKMKEAHKKIRDFVRSYEKSEGIEKSEKSNFQERRSNRDILRAYRRFIQNNLKALKRDIQREQVIISEIDLKEGSYSEDRMSDDGREEVRDFRRTRISKMYQRRKALSDLMSVAEGLRTEPFGRKDLDFRFVYLP